MKLTNIVDSENSYVYSTSYRFCFSTYAFSPATTVGPTDGDISKAISFMWQRHDRGSLGLLHTSLCQAVEEWPLFQLHRLSVLAWALGGGGARSVEALGILAKGAREAGDTFPFDDRILGAVRSFAPTLPPDSYILQLGKDAWSKWTSDGYVALAESLAWRSTFGRLLHEQEVQSRGGPQAEPEVVPPVRQAQGEGRLLPKVLRRDYVTTQAPAGPAACRL